MSSNTKDRLLNDLEALRQQLAQIEAYGTNKGGADADLATIPTLEVDNIPLLGDAVPADREEAIVAHREAMAQLDAELKELDNKGKSSSTKVEKAEAPSSAAPTSAESSSQAEAPYEAKQTENTPIEAVSIETRPTEAAPQPKAAVEAKKVPEAEQKPKVSLKASVEALSKLSQPKPLYADFSLEDTGPRETITEVDIPPSFSNPSTTNQKVNPKAMTSSTKASDENPFLPQHLRERLDKSKTSLLQEIARSSESLDASTALLRNFGGADYVKNLAPVIPTSTDPNNHQALVDTLVAKYLPLIEADLRQRLNTALQQQMASTIQNKKVLEPSH